MATTKQKLKKSDIQKYSAVIYEIDKGRKIPSFDVKYTKDLKGSFAKLKLIASKHYGALWADVVRGTTRVTVIDKDMGGVEITLGEAPKRPEIKISIDYADFCDIVTAFNAMDYFHKQKYGRSGKTPVKIGKVKKVGGKR
jgi:hypothetical protein